MASEEMGRESWRRKFGADKTISKAQPNSGHHAIASLVVYPAAGVPDAAKRVGFSLVILNRDPTDQDPMADLVLNLEIGPTLGNLVD